MQPPIEPFARWPVQRAVPEAGYLWRARRGVLVSHSVASRCTVVWIRAVVSAVDRMLACEDGIVEDGGITLLHDWRSLTTYEPQARVELFAAMRRRPQGYVRRTRVAVPPTPLWRMAMAGASLAYAFVGVRAPELLADARVLLSRETPPLVAPEPAPPGSAPDPRSCRGASTTSRRSNARR